MSKLKVHFTLMVVLSIFILAGMIACSNNANKISTYTFDVQGQITDLAGNPLSNVLVEFGATSVPTDTNGFYKVTYTQTNNTVAPIIKASAAGYETTSRNIGTEPGQYTVNVVLNPIIDKAAISEKAASSSTVLGDLNGDKKVTIIDALLAAKCANNQAVVPCNPKTADVNGDGSVTIIDALLISRYATGAITSFPKK